MLLSTETKMKKLRGGSDEKGQSWGKSPWATKQYVTWGSRVIPQRTTNRAQASLASEIGREPAFSGWFERTMPLWLKQSPISRNSGKETGPFRPHAGTPCTTRMFSPSTRASTPLQVFWLGTTTLREPHSCPLCTA